MSKAVEFDTREFVRAHGRNPSGRGSWAFETRDSRNECVNRVWVNGTYGEAKKEARAWAQAHGVSYLVVAS